MSVKLDWVNQPKWTFKEIRIYRSLTRIVDIANASLVATLPNGAVTFTDTTAPTNTVVHYRLVFVEQNDELVICSNQPYGHFPNGTGPGAQKVAVGTWGCGYFGIVLTSAIYTPDELRLVLGTASMGTPVITNAQMTYWHKFVFDGKILFYPQGALISGIRWSDIYKKGWMYGIDDTGPRLVTSNIPTPVNQKYVLTKGGFTYLVRTPRGLNKPIDAIYPTAGVVDDLVGSEWDSLLSASIVAGHSLPTNIAGLGRIQSLLHSGVEGTNWRSVTQHVSSAADVSHHRGIPGTIDYDLVVNNSNNGYWMPVLQLEYI